MAPIESALRTASRAVQVVQDIENSVFRTVSPFTRHEMQETDRRSA